MAINTLEYATIFMTALDKQIIETATSGWMEANSGQVIYSGGNEVKIPKISMTGLGDYDRDKGFKQGSVSYGYQSMTLTQDRATTFQLDAMDVDETNFGAAAGNVMGEFQKTWVVPEIDAYRYSNIASRAIKASKFSAYTPTAATIMSKLREDISVIQDIAGSGTEVVITMSIPTAMILDQADELTRKLDVSNFKQGGIDLKIKTIDGNPILRVPSVRMKSAYTFYDGESSGQEIGGFKATADSKNINWLITIRRAPIAVSKADITRIFDPKINQSASAWKIDYRRYHDLWIPDNAMAGVWANIGV